MASSNGHDVENGFFIIDTQNSASSATAIPQNISKAKTKRKKPPQGYHKTVIIGFVNNPDPNFLCGICDLILRQPVQSQCGHRFCKPCVIFVVKFSNSPVMCPPCRKEGNDADENHLSTEVYPDNAIRRILQKLPSKCPNSGSGCLWIGEFAIYEAHENECEYTIVLCPNKNEGCTAQLPKGQLIEHIQLQCPKRKIPCNDCNESVTVDSLESHNSLCSSSNSSLVTDSQTPKCFCEFGCEKELGNEKEEHNKEFLQLHISLINSKVAQLKDIVDGKEKLLVQNQIKKNINHIHRSQNEEVCNMEIENGYENEMAYQNPILPGSFASQISRSGPEPTENISPYIPGGFASLSNSRIDNEIQRSQFLSTPPTTSHQHPLSPEVVEIKQAVSNLTQRIQSVEEVVEQQQGSQADITQMVGSIRKPTAEDLVKKMEVTFKKAESFEVMVSVVNNSVENILTQVNEINLQRNSEREHLETQDRKVQQLEHALALKDVALADMSKRLDQIEQTSFDGTLIWKIHEFSKRRSEAVQGRQTSIYSPPFYTSRFGYKMCARIYFNGDGMGKGKYVSLFFVIMRGQYDSLLKWPFQQKVTLMLLDQSQAGEHVVDAFRPDPNSSSFRRPVSEMNIASGCPLFMPLTLLDSGKATYIKDDCVFVKVIVDTHDLTV